jgi:two-component system CheB/CheR fusion protein
VNHRARLLFGIRPADLGRPLRDLQVSYRPIELRSLIEKAEAERRPVTVNSVEWRTHLGEACWLDLHIAPLTDSAGTTIGTLISFSDLTTDHRLHRELEQSQQELETA